MSVTATEIEVLRIIKQKDSLISMKELSSKAGLEIGYTYMLCRSLEKQDCIGFFTRSACRITGKGKSMIS